MIPYCHPLAAVFCFDICEVRHARQSRRWYLSVRILLGSMKGCGSRRELAEGADAGVRNDFVELRSNMEVIHAK